MNAGKVLLTGATSQIGIFAIPRLLAAGFTVTALSRGPAPEWYPDLDGLRWAVPDAKGPGSTGAAGSLLSAGPIRLALQAVDCCPGLRRAVVFSTSSVYSKSGSSDMDERRQIEGILATETALARACEGRGIALSILRPTLVYGCGMDRNVTRLADWIRALGFLPVAGCAAGLRQPVHADDLARAAVATLNSAEPQALDTPLCGGSTLSYREMVEAIFLGLHKPVRILALPAGLLAAISRVTRFIPGLRGITPAMVRRQSVDLVFDDRAARETLQYEPRPFTPGSTDFALPEPELIRRIAGR